MPVFFMKKYIIKILIYIEIREVVKIFIVQKKMQNQIKYFKKYFKSN